MRGKLKLDKTLQHHHPAKTIALFGLDANLAKQNWAIGVSCFIYSCQKASLCLQLVAYPASAHLIPKVLASSQHMMLFVNPRHQALGKLRFTVLNFVQGRTMYKAVGLHQFSAIDTRLIMEVYIPNCIRGRVARGKVELKPSSLAPCAAHSYQLFHTAQCAVAGPTSST